MLNVILIFLGIILILIGYFNIKMNGHEKPIRIEIDPDEEVLRNAGIGNSKDILKQRATWEDQFEQKPGEIFDNIFNGRLIGLLSS